MKKGIKKLFLPVERPKASAGQRSQKFFASFFQKRRSFFCLLFLCASNAHAAPYIPTGDGVVLEHLPGALDPAVRAARRLDASLAADPGNLPLAVQAARADIDRARALGDPRYLGRAEAALARWPTQADTPPQVLLLRAVILQSNHDFTTSLALLGQMLATNRDNAQALLTRAAIHQAQADYPAALADCGQVATQILGLVPDVCTASVMSLTGHARLALRAVTLSLQVFKVQATRAPSVGLWALTLAAETADRLDDPSAEARFAEALAVDPADPYLLGAWSDWLLDHGRAAEVVRLLSGRTRVDPLLLRLALAEQALGAPEAAGHVADLGARFEASRLRGDTVHRREEARFELALRHDPVRALALARANWDVQREPADARILLECVLAAGRPDLAAPALDWLARNHVDDVRLQALAVQARGAVPSARG